MNIVGPLKIVAYVLLISIQVYFRLFFLIFKKISFYHLRIIVIEFCILSFFCIYAFQNFDAYIQENHLVNKRWSWILLLSGYLSYFVNNLLADRKPKKIEILFFVSMWISLSHSVLSIFELVTLHEYKILKLLL